MGKKNKKQTVGYKYFVGAHLVLCHGPIDRILQIYADDKLLWTQLSDDQGVGVRGGYENINLHAPELFGGEDREGGISGDIEIGMGYRDQGVNGYLTHVLANKLIPAYRGVVSVILKQIYCGTSPYLKPWKFRAQRIWAPTATDRPQWAPAIAGIGDPGQLISVPTQLAEYPPMTPTSFMIRGVHYQFLFGLRRTAQTGPGPSVITLVVSDFLKGTSTPQMVPVNGNPYNMVTPPLPMQAPYADYRINPLTRDYRILPGGKKVLFPLCLASLGGLTSGPYQFQYFYAAIFDLETHAIQHIRYPNSEAMAAQRGVFADHMRMQPHRQRLGPRAVGMWDDLGEKYIVLGGDGNTYKLDPLAGSVTAFTPSDFNLGFNSHVLTTAKMDPIRQFTLVYTSLSVNGRRVDYTNAYVHDIRTGQELWVSGSDQVFIGMFEPWANIDDIAAIPTGDGMVYCAMPHSWRYHLTGGKRYLAFNTISPLTGTHPVATDLGLPPILDAEGDYGGLGEAPVYAADGRIYLFPVSAMSKGVIITPSSRKGQVTTSASLMPWVMLPTGRDNYIQVVSPFLWQGGAMVMCRRQGSDQWMLEGTLGSPAGDSSTSMPPVNADMNPIHIIRECMTNSEWGRGLPDSIIGPSYTVAANTIYKERLGLSMLWTSEMAINDFILEVIRHIDAVRYEDPETGLQEIKLIRPDYDVATLPVLSPSNCTLEQLTEPTLYDLVNQITVNFWNRDTGEDSAIAAQDTASINMTGTINNQTMEYSGICRTDVALAVAQRDLARYSKPFRQGRLIVNRKVANLKPGDPFILTWPERGVDRLVCRAAMRSDNGELDGQLGIEFGEDIFSQSYNIASVPPPSGWEDPIAPPVNFDFVTMFDVPYVMLVDLAGETVAAATPNDTSYSGFAGARPLAGMHLQYGCFMYPAGTTPPTDSQKEIRESFTPLGITSEDVAEFTDAVITLPLQVANDMGNARVGDWVLVGDAADRSREVLCIAEEPGNKPVALKVTRAAADTYPRAIPKGTPLYLVGTFYAYDEIERVSGEAVAGYGVPKNGKGAYPGPFTYLQIDMVGRQGLPYPAAGFKVDGSYQDSLAPEHAAVTLTWHHRNRIQQANQALSWLTGSDVPLEAGVSYQVRQAALDDSMGVISELPLLPVGQVSSVVLDLLDQPYPKAARFARLSVEAVKGGRVSLQNRPITVKLAPRLYAPTGLQAEYIGRPKLVAPSNLRAAFVPAVTPLTAPAHLVATYVGPDKLVAPSNLEAFYTGPDKLVAPDHLAAVYSGPDKLVAPSNLRATYVGQAKLVAPTDLRASYVGTPRLQRPSDLYAAFTPGTAPLVAPVSLVATYSGQDKMVAPDLLVAAYVGPGKLVAPDLLAAAYAGPAKLVAPGLLVAAYTGPAKLVAPDLLVANYRGAPVLQRPADLMASYFSGVYRLQAPVDLSATYH
jgi:hypothetical protein